MADTFIAAQPGWFAVELDWDTRKFTDKAYRVIAFFSGKDHNDDEFQAVQCIVNGIPEARVLGTAIKEGADKHITYVLLPEHELHPQTVSWLSQNKHVLTKQ